MQNSKLPFTLLFLGLALLTYQFLTHPTPQEEGLTRRFFIGKGDLAEDASNNNFHPTHHEPKMITPRVAGLAPAASPVLPVPEATPALKPAVDINALAKATDAKIKGEDDKKKKKKKKKTVSPFPDATAQIQVPDVNPLAAQSADEIGGGAVAPNAAAAGAAAGGTLPDGTGANGNDKSLISYYEGLLLKDPNSAETQKFVAAYKAKQVDDNVYFTIAAAMMADSRLQMKDLAVYLYGQATNLRSFEALIAVLDTDTANDVVKTDSLKYLNTYSDVTVAGTTAVLSQALALNSTSPNLHLEALKLLDTATKQYAQLESTQTISSAGQATGQSYTPTNAQKIFTPFLTLLSNIARTSSDSNTKSIASQDAGDIQSLIGNESASINQ